MGASARPYFEHIILALDADINGVKTWLSILRLFLNNKIPFFTLYLLKYPGQSFDLLDTLEVDTVLSNFSQNLCVLEPPTPEGCALIESGRHPDFKHNLWLLDGLNLDTEISFEHLQERMSFRTQVNGFFRKYYVGELNRNVFHLLGPQEIVGRFVEYLHNHPDRFSSPKRARYLCEVVKEETNWKERISLIEDTIMDICNPLRNEVPIFWSPNSTIKPRDIPIDNLLVKTTEEALLFHLKTDHNLLESVRAPTSVPAVLFNFSNSSEVLGQTEGPKYNLGEVIAVLENLLRDETPQTLLPFFGETIFFIYPGDNSIWSSGQVMKGKHNQYLITHLPWGRTVAQQIELLTLIGSELMAFDETATTLPIQTEFNADPSLINVVEFFQLSCPVPTQILCFVGNGEERCLQCFPNANLLLEQFLKDRLKFIMLRDNVEDVKAKEIMLGELEQLGNNSEAAQHHRVVIDLDTEADSLSQDNEEESDMETEDLGEDPEVLVMVEGKKNRYVVVADEEIKIPKVADAAIKTRKSVVEKKIPKAANDEIKAQKSAVEVIEVPNFVPWLELSKVDWRKTVASIFKEEDGNFLQLKYCYDVICQ